MIDYNKIRLMKKDLNNCYSKRILTELEYAIQVSDVNDNIFDDCIQNAIDNIYAYFVENKTITKNQMLECEKILFPIRDAAKKYKLYCVSHAHIDMNWMWSYNETVAITLDTFRTVLKLMCEYPQLTYSQSQTSTYKIVEDNDPFMFEEIQKRVREGRWEITASTWVEADKNMSDGESQARHILYTKQYFRDKFGVAETDLELDFEPDTFGHNASVPEILSKGGVKYYYHCRGQVKHDIFNWKAKSGEQILVYKEPFWYNAQITPDFILPYPKACQKNKTDFMLKVYGVGDHGGGPTRRDIENLMDMAQWPIAPTIEFSTYRAFFINLEKNRNKFPDLNEELNYVFTGCYSSQSRLKTANRTAENSLFLTENINALAATFCGGKNFNPNFKKAWERTMFNQFHDILTGSGVRETREHAMGIFQEAMGFTHAAKSAAYSEIAENIDTSAIESLFDKNSFAEGAGVGFKGNASFSSATSGGFEVSVAETGNGETRIMHLFNSTQYEREEPFEITIWDYDGALDNLSITDVEGMKIKFELFESAEFWAHKFTKILAFCKVPSFGYTTLIIKQDTGNPFVITPDPNPRLEIYEENILENEMIKAKFDTSMNLVELIDKVTNEKIINQKSAFFKLVIQNYKCETVMPGSAWVEGYTMNEISLNDTRNVEITARKKIGDMRQYITYNMNFGKSTIKATVSLDANSKFLKFNIECDWFEIFDEKNGIPALKFNVPFNYKADNYSYKIPFGTIQRLAVNHDVPAIGFGFAKKAGVDQMPTARGLGLVTDSIYAFHGENNAIELTLVRGSQFPDPCPEYGLIHKQVGIVICEDNNKEFFEISSEFSHPVVSFTNRSHKGILPMESTFLHIEGDVQVSALKLPEDSSEGLVIRGFEIAQKDSSGTLVFNKKIKSAVCLGITEQPCPKSVIIDENRVTIDLAPNEIFTMKILF